jgi:lysophospholipase L1-like esterase
LGEAGLRISTGSDFATDRAHFMSDRIVLDPILGWRNVPGLWDGLALQGDAWTDTTYRVNALGLRGPETGRAKPAGIQRILFLGDSGTYGVLNFPSEKRRSQKTIRAITSYPDVLRQRLREAGRMDIEVLNGGVIGYSSSHGLRLLVVHLLDLDPDIVVLRFGANDCRDAWAPERRALEPRQTVMRSLFYAFADWKLTRLFLRAWQRMPNRHAGREGVRWTDAERYLYNLRRFAELSRQHGFRLLLLDYPFEPRSAEMRQRLAQVEDIKRRFARDQDLPLLVTGSQLRPGSEFFTPPDVVHPNPSGARLLAQLIHQRLVTLGWLPRRDARHPSGA